MKNRIVYLMSGAPHTPYLVVSLKTLRDHYADEVVVYAYPESFDIVQRIAEDSALEIRAELWEPEYRGKNSQFVNKILVMQSQDQPSLYLDADTSIHGSLDLLFGTLDEYPFVATQFNNWKTSGKIIRNRVKRLKQFPKIDQTLVDTILEQSFWPSVNGGVFAARPDSKILPLWYKWSMEARSIFIADEIVLHILQPRFAPSGEMVVVEKNGAYNTSPKHQSKTLPNDDVRIMHYHGDSNVRPNKSRRGYSIWWSIYQLCLKDNVGGICEWIGGVQNKWMNKLEKEEKHD